MKEKQIIKKSLFQTEIPIFGGAAELAEYLKPRLAQLFSRSIARAAIETIIPIEFGQLYSCNNIYEKYNFITG